VSIAGVSLAMTKRLSNGSVVVSKLDPVQIAALEASKGKKGFGFFMDMGTGKSLTALEEFRRTAEAKIATRMIIVAPNSFKRGWLDEIEKHGFDFDAYVFVSGSKANEKWLTKRYEKPPIIVLNYEAIRSPQVLLR